jgi:hypothetical protein
VVVKPQPFLGLIQFPHPGSEHNAARFENGVFPWNAGDHHRKFLEANGRWREEDGSVGAGDLRFWGEYEPPSSVRRIGPRSGSLPQWVHEPLYPPAADGPRQNTDPLVLGGFHYSNCKQHRRRDHHSPSVMQRLERGSVVLFGSKLDNVFVLDTVFVVARRQEYGREDVGDLAVPEHVKDMALRPLYSDPERELRFVLYEGATVDQPVDGLWSFVPALPVVQPSDRLARPRVVLDEGILNEALPMGLRKVAMPSSQLESVWIRVLETTYASDLVAATHVDVPRTDEAADTAGSGGRGRPC